MLRSFSARLLKRKLELCLAGLAVFLGVGIGMYARSQRREACDAELTAAEALRQADRDGARAALLAAAKTCDAVDRSDDAEQMRREAAVAASSEAARRSAAANRAASFAAAVADAQRHPDRVTGVASAVEAYPEAAGLTATTAARVNTHRRDPDEHRPPQLPR